MFGYVGTLGYVGIRLGENSRQKKNVEITGGQARWVGGGDKLPPFIPLMLLILYNCHYSYPIYTGSYTQVVL